MNGLCLIMASALVLFQISAGAQELLPPTDSTKESRSKDMARCVSAAQGKAAQPYSYLGIWDDLKKQVIKDRNTGGYVYAPSLSNRPPTPVSNADGNPVRRESLFEASNELSDRYVMCLLSSGYRWKDSAKAYTEEVKELALAGLPPAQAELGQLYLSYSHSPSGQLNYSEFAAWTRKAAEQGYALAQFNLAYAYIQGDGVEKDEREGLRWLKMSAEKGYDRARPILQRAGKVEADLTARRQDVRNLDADRKAAEAGDASAQFTMGSRYEDGRGVDRDMKEAIDWYRKAAANGNVEALAYLGVIYDRGRGVKQDDAEAATWYRKAADKGHGRAQFALGVFNLYGRGMPKNKDEARAWLERARDSGVRGAESALKDNF